MPNKPSKDHREAVEAVWENADDHKGKALARWAKKGKGFKGRIQRWETVEWFLHVHQMSTRIDEDHHAQDLRRRATFWRMYRWARAKRRGIQRRHKPKPSQPSSGVSTGSWGGSQAAGEACATSVASRFELTITSRKRAANDPLSISNPSSDHNEANTTAYAWDIGTFSGEPVARAMASCLGIGNWTPGNYNSYYITRPWGRFRVQILWAVAGHFNHVHTGIRRA